VVDANCSDGANGAIRLIVDPNSDRRERRPIREVRSE
jgi:hypothetical protein